MRIYVFQRPDGSFGADYSETYAKRMGRIVETHSAKFRAGFEALIANPGTRAPARVRALAERGLAELVARKAPPVDAPVPADVRERNFWRRLRWVFVGR